LSISESDQATIKLKPLVERLVQRGVGVKCWLLLAGCVLSIYSYHSLFLSKMTAQIHILKGDPKHEIVRLSNEIGADMLVIGSRGLGAVKRLTMGSVSDCK
jgi:nucleotide-binding universal stress UspA family protein